MAGQNSGEKNYERKNQLKGGEKIKIARKNTREKNQGKIKKQENPQKNGW